MKKEIREIYIASITQLLIYISGDDFSVYQLNITAYMKICSNNMNMLCKMFEESKYEMLIELCVV